MPRMVFLPGEEEVLVQEVQKRPEIYDYSDPNYKNIVDKEELWKEISSKTGKSVKECKSRWRNIKDAYSRSKRKLGRSPATAENKTWPLAAHLSFLDNVDCERKLKQPRRRRDSGKMRVLQKEDVNNYSCNDDDDRDSVESFQEEETINDFPGGLSHMGCARSKQDKLGMILTKQLKARNIMVETIQRQNEKLLSREESQNDDIDLFFKSIAITVKKLPAVAISEAKIKVLTAISQIEEKYSVHHQPTLANSPIQNIEVAVDQNCYQTSGHKRSHTQSN